MPFVTRIALAALVTLAGALAVRFGFIETPQLAWACQVEAGAPWWCPLRQGTVFVLRAGVIGIFAACAGIVAIIGGGRIVTGAAVIAGTAGLVLYAAGPAALGLILGGLRALRL